MSRSLPLLLALALAGCDLSTTETPVSSDAAPPNSVSITETSITDDKATISWSASGPEPAEHWRLYQNNLLVCSADLDLELSPSDASGNYQQSDTCTLSLEDGENSIYVQLCNISENGTSTCSTSAIKQIFYEAADPTPGAISWQDLPSSTSATTIIATWLKADGGNGDYWFVYHDGAQACSGTLSYVEDYVAQSADCTINLAEGVNQLQAELCSDQPAGIQDLCSQSEVASVTFALDPAQELATPVLDALEASIHYASIDTNISWHKDTSSGSAGDAWSLYHNGTVVCQAQLADGATSASCTIQLTTGDNALQVELCTDITTYSGASCTQSATLAVSALDPEPVTPGLIRIANVSTTLAETSDSVAPLEWVIDIGNGVQHWSVDLNGVEYCVTSSTSEYYQQGSCLLNLVVGINTISVRGCNYGYDDVAACSTSEAITTERVALPGTPELTSSLPTTTYAAEHNLSWERTTGASAERWLAFVDGDIESDQCHTELNPQTPQGDSCIVELGSGINEVLVRLCVDSSTAAYCVDSASLYTELLAPIPGTPEISTASQSIADDSIELEWSKSSGEHGSYWLAWNNDAEVAACADRPLLSAGDGQSGSCDLPLAVGENLVSVRLCNDNNAGTASCADSTTISITRLVASPEFTSAASVSTAENSVAVFYTATVQDNDSSAEQISFALSGGADVDFFQLDSTSGALAFHTPVDYEIPQDSDADNVYQLNITATDELEGSAQLELAVSLSNANDNLPILTTPPASLAVAENDSSVIYTFTASDLDGDALSYSLDGADAQHLTLGAASGTLQFQSAPDYETPLDANQDNVYELNISVSDGEYHSSALLSIVVDDSNDEVPQATSASSVALAIDSLVVGATIYTATATDADASDQITYALGGADQQHFTLDTTSGELAFSQLPASLDDPQDANGDNIYEVLITLADLGANSSELALSVSVVAFLGSIPEFAQATASVAFDENAVGVVYTAQATDADAEALTYSISGVDSSLFAIDSASGALEFNSSPDYEQPADSDSDNIYDLAISATDPVGNQAQQSLTVSINNLNDNAPQFALSSNTFDIPENTVAITTITASDTDADTLTYAITASADSELFTIDPASGALAFISAPNFETPQDANADNVYQLAITATDGAYSAGQDLTITVADVNEAPTFTEPSVALTTAENNSSFIYTVAAAIDPDQGQTLTYQLSGTDASAFDFDPTTRALAFITTPNYENAKDQDADNTYQIAITATDGEYSASQDLVIAVADLNDETPQFTSPSSQSVDYSTVEVGAIVYTAQASDADAGDQITYALGGVDSGYFSFDTSSGALAFYQLPALADFPEDGSIAYALSITATDLAANSSTLDLSVSLLDDTGSAPTFAQASVSIAVDENSADTVYTAQASDVDSGDILSYSISGADADSFTINSSSGALAFQQAPDFENPADDNSDNTYELTITVTDSMAKQAQQSLTISVNNLNDNSPQFTLSSNAFTVSENSSIVATITASDADSDTLTYTLTNTSDAAAFTLDPSSGVLAFDPAPDYETPLDSDGDNVYQLTLSAFDGANTATQAITITVSNIDEAPTFAAASQDLPVNENASGSVYQAQASDPEGAALTYSASGADASLFTLDSTSGDLAFITQPNYENPLDQDADNIYQLSITASDGANQATQAVAITIADVNEAPSFTEPSVALATAENNLSFIYTAAAAIDPDQNQQLTYQLSGTDAAAFNFDAATRALSFQQSPDFEAAKDQDANNVYQLSVVASDGEYDASQSITITVADLNDEAPRFTSLGSQVVDYTKVEVGDVIYTATATDADANDQITYALSGADASTFTLDSASGALAFAQLPPLEQFPEDSGITYQLVIAAADLAANSSTLDLTVSLLDDTGSAPEFAEASASVAVDENIATTIYTAQATDVDPDDTLSYSLSGIDHQLFSIDAASGALTFNSPPDHEQPLDDGGDNVYDLAIVVTDFPVGNQAQQILTVSVNNLNDNPPQFALSSSTFSIPENSTAITTVAASDADGDDLTFSLTNTTDSSLFAIDAASGALAFTSAPDFENPADDNADNTYELTLSVFDGSHTITQQITITVTNVDEVPSFASATVDLPINENTSGAVYQAQATDPEQATLAYSISGADASRFNLGASSGELAFKNPPNFEVPLDQDANNVYELSISAADGANQVSQAVTITVADVNEAPSFTTTSVALNTAENNLSFTHVVDAATDEDSGEQLTYQLSGADQSAFDFDPDTRILGFKSTPDYESPEDQGADNVYQINIVASDSEYSTSQAISIAVAGLNDEAPQFTSAGTQSVDYSTAQVGAVVYSAQATDADAGDQITYALGGADAANFDFNSSNGELSFNQLPGLEDFPAEGSIDYALSIAATDLAANSSDLALSISLLDDTGSAPTFAQASASINVDENTASAVYTAQATDVDAGDALTYSISGTDSSLFTIDPSSGALTFNTAPDFETPADSGGDNIYNLSITATDSVGKQAQQSLAISVNNLNDNPPQFALSSTAFDVPENTTAIATIAATDVDGDTLTFALITSTDAAAFVLDPASGVLVFAAAPDFENPADNNADNTYQLELSVFDGANTSTESITIAVVDLNDEAPQFTSATSLALDFTSVVVGATVYSAQATDADAGDQITYALSGADASHFSLDNSSGELAFIQAPSLDAPQDADGDNFYQITITATDLAANSTDLALSINVVDDTGSAPTFASASVSIDVDENTASTIYTAQASDVDPGDILTYSISGTDSSLFTIGSSNGELTFNTVPDFEAPEDDGQDNTYDLSIAATDSIGKQAQQSLTISVNNLNDNQPQFNLSSSAFSTPENSTAVTTITAADADGDDLTLALTNTTDSSHFTLDPASGALAFVSAPDYENPADDNSDNIYELELSVADGTHTTTQSISVAVTNVDEAPSFAATTQDLSVSENSSASVYQAQASDPEGATLAYSASGIDAGLFDLDSASGELTFKQSPNFENPIDSDSNNVYQLDITASDGANQTSQAVSITIADVNEAPTFASASVNIDTAENAASFAHVVDAADDPDQGEQLTYQLGGDDAAAFDFDAATRALSFKQSPDYESPQDQDADNTYQITITAADSQYSTSQAIAIAIADLNDEAPQFTSASSLALDYTSIVLDATVYTAQATDADANDQIAYTISGADASHFSLDNSSGALAFAQAPSLDSPQDADGDNFYQLSITATDLNANSTDLALSVNVVDDTGSAPTFDQASVSIDVDENTISTIYTAQASDVDPGDILTYSISGTDSSHFTIDPSSGELSFTSAPDYENPSDSGADNTYELAITATDSIGKQASQSLAISVNNLNDNAPQFTLASSAFDVLENAAAVTTITATDPDGDDLSFALISTTDSSHFTLDPASGALSFNQAPDFENPQDANADNTYELELSVSDGAYTTTQAISVSVTNVNDVAPSFAATTDSSSVSENTSGVVYTASATDIEGDTLTYSLGGTDSAHFTIDSSNGELSLANALDFENPTDQNSNNDYELEITASDGTNSAALALTISVQDLNDNTPSFATASETIQVPENTSGSIYTAAATDLDATDTITYSLAGTDSALLQIGASSGALSFQQAPDYENPQDQDANNFYELSIVASDGTNSASLALSIEILDTSERPPEITQLIGGDQAIDFTFDDFGTSKQLSIYRFTDDACSTAELASDHTQCYASDDSSGDTARLDFSGALSSADYQVSDSGLRAGQRYYYQIWAAESSSATDIGVWSVRYSAMTWPAADVGTTLGYDASETGGTQVVLSFVAPSSGDDDYYHFLRHSDPDCASYAAGTALNRADYSDWSALVDPVNGGLCSGLTELTLSSTNLHAPSGGASDSHTDSGLAEGTTYYYLLRTVNYSGANGVDFTTRSGASATSNQLHWTTVPPAPAADDLEILSSPAVAADQISIAFASVAGASSYKLVRYIPANCSIADQQISSVESCSGSDGYAEQDFNSAQSAYTDSGLQAGTTYAYQYRALNAAGSSQYSPAVSATTTFDKPTISLTSSVSLADANVISVSWSASSGIDSYSVLGSSNESCLISATASADPQASAANCDHSISASAASSATSIDIDQLDDGSALASGSYYYFAAAAVSSSGSSEYSDTASAITAPASPNVISLSPGYQQVEVAWDVPTGSAENVLYRYTESTCSLSSFPSNCGLDTGSYTFTNSIPNDAYIDDNSGNGLVDNQMYYYALQASNAGGARYTESASVPVVLTAPKTPDSLIASGERLAVQLRWGSSPTDADDGVAGYEILRSSSSTCYGSAISAYADYASCPDSALFLFDYGSGEDQNEYQFSDSELDPSSGSEPLTGGSTYYYWIRSFYGSPSTSDAVYSASTSAPASATPILPAPTNLAVDAEQSGASTDISIAWDEVATASGYVLYRTTSADCLTIVNRNTSEAQNDCADYQREELSGSSTTTTTHSDLPSDTIYYYYVAAANSAVEGELSSALSTRSATVAPTITSTQTYSNTVVRVEWDASSAYDATYHLYAYSGDSSCNPFTTECPHESLTTFTADGSSDYYNYAQQLEPGTHYNFKMLAITEYEQEDGTEDFVHGAISSAAATATTAANHPTITGHEYVDYNYFDLFVSIEGGLDSVLYWVLYTLDANCSVNDVIAGQCAVGGQLGTAEPASSIRLANYDFGVYYYVLSLNSEDYSLLSPDEDTPPYLVPARPAQVELSVNATKNSSGNGSDVKIEWQQSSGVDGYVLYRTTSSGCITDSNRNDSSTKSNCDDYQRQEISGSSTTTTTHSNLPNDTIYHYSVATISNGSEGTLSESIATHTATTAPPIVDVITYNQSQIEVTWWATSAFETDYYIYAYSGDASCDPHAEVCPGEKLVSVAFDFSAEYTTVFTGLTPGTRYNFKAYSNVAYPQENGGTDYIVGYISESAKTNYTFANHPTITGHQENDDGDILLEFAIDGGTDDLTYYIFRTTNGDCTITEVYNADSECTDRGTTTATPEQNVVIHKVDDNDYYYHVISANPVGPLAWDDSTEPYYIPSYVVVKDIDVEMTHLVANSNSDFITINFVAAEPIPADNKWTVRFYPALIENSEVREHVFTDEQVTEDLALAFQINAKYYFHPHRFELYASRLDDTDFILLASFIVWDVQPPPLVAVEKNADSNKYSEEKDFDIYIQNYNGDFDVSSVVGIETLEVDITMIFTDADAVLCRPPYVPIVDMIYGNCPLVRSYTDWWDGSELLFNRVEGDTGNQLLHDVVVSNNESYQASQGLFQVYDITFAGTTPIYDDQDDPWSFFVGPYISSFTIDTDFGKYSLDYEEAFSYLSIELAFEEDDMAEFKVYGSSSSASLLPTPTLVLSPALLSQGLSAGSAYNSWDLHLLWEAINGINSYAIHEYSDSDCAYLLSAPELCGNYNLHSSLSPDFTHAFAAADMGSYFYYRLQAYDAAGNSSELGEQIAVHIPQALNDSGVDICVVSDALSGAQDCASGRDANVDASAKVGTGSAGFDFSLLETDDDADTSSDSHCVHDNTTGLSWSSWSVPADELASAADPDYETNATRSSATFAELATISLDACGYSDWSLPSIHELLSIADYNQTDARIDRSIFTDFNSSQPSYWSASGHILDFSSGDISLEANASASHSVLLVRADRRWGHDFGAERFQLVEHIDDGNTSIHLVYDNHSQLHYAPCLAGQSYDPINHSCLGTPTELDYIDSLNAYDSNSTWRQPNIKELIAILDPTNHLLPNPTYFPNPTTNSNPTSDPNSSTDSDSTSDSSTDSTSDTASDSSTNPDSSTGSGSNLSASESSTVSSSANSGSSTGSNSSSGFSTNSSSNTASDSSTDSSSDSSTNSDSNSSASDSSTNSPYPVPIFILTPSSQSPDYITGRQLNPTTQSTTPTTSFTTLNSHLIYQPQNDTSTSE